MNIIIAGDGKLGNTISKHLTSEGHDITVIDSSKQALESSIEQYDIMSIYGNCATKEVLVQAGIKEADLLIAVTGEDEVNLLCSVTAHALNPNLHTIARIRNPEYTNQIYDMKDVYDISLAINPEKQSGDEIARLIKYPGFLKRDTFVKGRVEIVELKVNADSKLCNVSLSDMYKIVNCKVLVCVVLRNGEAIIPTGNFVLQEGDLIFVTAPFKNLTTMLKNLGIITRKAKKVLICGGGRISYYLANRLQKDGITATIIEQNHDRCVHLSEILPNTNIICGDVSDQKILEKEGIADCDAIVNLTGLDELNIILSLYANNIKVPQVITKVGKISEMSILDELDIGSVICPKELCCDNIVRFVRAMKNQTGAATSVHAIADNRAEALEFNIDETTKNAGIPLKDITLRKNTLLASIIHEGLIQIPDGDSVFVPGDTVIVITTGEEIINQFNEIFD